MSGNTSKMPPSRPRWRSLALRPVIVALLLLSELALIAAIIALWVLSALQAGFTNVGFRGSASEVFSAQGSLNLGQSLLWTALPTLIFTLYRIFREAVVSALVVETPFMELHKSSAAQPTKVRKSVYVDYRTSFSIVAWYKALRNRHIFLGLCMLASFVVSLALVPLAGGLFAEGEELLGQSTAVNVFSTFDPSAEISLLDYGRLFDAVSASWINNAPYPAGTDGGFPLPHIKPVQDLQNYTVSSTVKTSQLSLDCQTVNDATIAVEDETENISRTMFSANDRDCTISGDVLTTSVKNPNPDYLKAISELECPDWAGRTRVILFYVKTTLSGDLQSSTLLSCIPSYWTVNGTVEATGTTGLTGRLAETLSFAERSRAIEELPGLKRRQFEEGIMNVQTINIGNEVNSAGRLVELVARYIDSKNLEFTEGGLTEALSTIFPALYTILCVDQFYPTLVQPVLQDGILRIPENRLHVVIPVAIAMLSILALLIAETVCLIVYLQRHPSILAEEPVGLVGAANLLHDSNIPPLIAMFHDKPGSDGRLRRPIPQADKSETLYTDDQLLDRDCWVERDEALGRLKIVVETKAEGEGSAYIHRRPIPECRRAPASYLPYAPQYVTRDQPPTTPPVTAAP